jgi:hypothetical protein
MDHPFSAAARRPTPAGVLLLAMLVGGAVAACGGGGGGTPERQALASNPAAERAWLAALAADADDTVSAAASGRWSDSGGAVTRRPS